MPFQERKERDQENEDIEKKSAFVLARNSIYDDPMIDDGSRQSGHVVFMTVSMREFTKVCLGSLL